MGKSLDELLRGIGNAVTDIRHKLVEEGYFGRVVTDGTTQIEIAPADSESQETGPGPGVPAPKANQRDSGPGPERG